MLTAGDFIKEELLDSLFPDFRQKQKNGFLSSFQLSVLLYLFSAIFKSAAYFGVCFSWVQNSILLLCQKHLPLFSFIIFTATSLCVQLQSCVSLKTTLSRKAKKHFTKDKTKQVCEANRWWSERDGVQAACLFLQISRAYSFYLQSIFSFFLISKKVLLALVQHCFGDYQYFYNGSH